MNMKRCYTTAEQKNEQVKQYQQKYHQEYDKAYRIINKDIINERQRSRKQIINDETKQAAITEG